MAAHQALLLRPMMMHHHRVVAISSSTSSSSPTAPPAGRYSSCASVSQSIVTSKCRGFQQQQQQRQRRLLQFPIDAVPGAVLGVEPDLEEDYIDGSEFKTAGEDTQEADFPYGKLDGAHTYHKGDDNLEFFDAWSTVIEEAGGPNDNPFQATISWLFLPAIFSGLAFGVEPEYLFLGTAIFIFSFIGVEMNKPDKESNFEYDPNFPGKGYKP